jgi:hypothetical protein
MNGYNYKGFVFVFVLAYDIEKFKKKNNFFQIKLIKFKKNVYSLSVYLIIKRKNKFIIIKFLKEFN